MEGSVTYIGPGNVTPQARRLFDAASRIECRDETSQNIHRDVVVSAAIMDTLQRRLDEAEERIALMSRHIERLTSELQEFRKP